MPAPARTIRVGFPQDPEARVTDDSILPNVHDLAPSRLPVVLHINHSSRSYALEHLVLGFGSTPSEFDKVYWNPKIDTIYLPPFNPEEESSSMHSMQYRERDPLSLILNVKFWQGWLRRHRFSLLALDKIQHLALCFPDNSLNEKVEHDEDLELKHGMILHPKPGPAALSLPMGELNWGIDERIALCGNLKTLTWVGDSSLFSGVSDKGTPSIREVDEGERVDKKLLKQGRAVDFVTGRREVLVYNAQFLKSFESCVELERGKSLAMREWNMPRLAVGKLEFEKERVVSVVSAVPAVREKGDDEEDYDSGYLSDDIIDVRVLI